MLELVVIAIFTGKFATLADNRGHSKAWGLAAAVSWFGGEAIGFLIGRFIGQPAPLAYGLAIIFGAVGLALAWRHVKSLPDRWIEA